MEKKKNEEIVEVLCKKFIEASVEAIKLFHVVRIRTLEKYLFTHKERQRQRRIDISEPKYQRWTIGQETSLWK